MLNLAIRTEYSFGVATGKIDSYVDQLNSVAGICDNGGTWGHVKWDKLCRSKGLKPIFGVELACVENCDIKEKKQHRTEVRLIAKNNEGLKELYEAVAFATEKFYYVPRIDYDYVNSLSSNVFVLLGKMPLLDLVERNDSIYFEIRPGIHLQTLHSAIEKGFNVVATNNNYYPRPEDRDAYEIMMNFKGYKTHTWPMWLLNESEWHNEFSHLVDPGIIRSSIENSQLIAEQCNATLKKAKLVKPKLETDLMTLCIEGAKKRGIDLDNPVYKARLEKELSLIEEKNFADYFKLVAEITTFARQHMLVGPARGSSCGSLVCYLIDITSIDPIPFDLLFERFIDINRMDYPDIDIDFAEDKRDMVFDYLVENYGIRSVAHLGTVGQYKPKSALIDVSKCLQVPAGKLYDLKNSIIERSSGDSRAGLCLVDTFTGTEVGKKILKEHPEIAIAGKLEAHAHHHGVHAAGIVVTDDDLTNYCAIDVYNNKLQIDKYDAEALDLIKIDALGLRTLSVIQDTLDRVGWSYEDLEKYRLDDNDAFQVINDKRFAGIFQFEGYALQNLCHQTKIEQIDDIVAITALARPGPLSSGSTSEYIKRRNGEVPVTYIHPSMEDVTKGTYGVVIYQEQVMQVGRSPGGLSWEDVSELRKAMSKSKGKEFFERYWDKFKLGTRENGIDDETSREIWDTINTMGSWAFNKSHAVAYGIISYWCCVLKSKFLMEFAASTLCNAKSEDQAIQILRELSAEGIKYKPYDPVLSQDNWTVHNDVLIGGLKNIKGIGDKMAEDIILRRKTGKDMTKRQKTLLAQGETPYDSIFKCQDLWGHIYANPLKYNIKSKLTKIGDITENFEGNVVCIGQLKEKNLRDMNELILVEKRGGEIKQGQTAFLVLLLEDDTGSINCRIPPRTYLQVGKKIAEEDKIGDWYLFKGRISKGFRMVWMERIKKITDNKDYEK